MKRLFDMPYFGSVDLSQLEECYETSIECKGQSIRLDLNFWIYDGETMQCMRQITNQMADALKTALSRLDQYVDLSWAALRKDWVSRGQAREYTDHHAEEVAALSGLDEEAIFAKILPSRCGFYPFSSSRYLIVDFTLGETVTNYVLAVALNDAGFIESIDMES